MNIEEILENHKKWLDGKDDGIRADLSGADLSGADLSGADLSGADLSGANLSWANLSGANLSVADLSVANLSGANLSGADLSRANLSWANLSGANLSRANLSWANLSGANLSGANLSGANLSRANLSGAENLLSAIDYLKDNFEFAENGMIVYKVFSGMYKSPETWAIQPGSTITENVNLNRSDDCGCGINVATLDWVKRNYNGEIWKILIRWEWLAEVVVPYNTDGKIRCGRAELLEIVTEIKNEHK